MLPTPPQMLLHLWLQLVRRLHVCAQLQLHHQLLLLVILPRLTLALPPTLLL